MCINTETNSSKAYIEWLTIQFPDPWTKKKHHKRRLVDAQFVADCARLMPDKRSKVYICSDRYDLACFMYDTFAASALWRVVPEIDVPTFSTNLIESATVQELSQANAISGSDALSVSLSSREEHSDKIVLLHKGVAMKDVDKDERAKEVIEDNEECGTEESSAFCREVYRKKDVDDMRHWLTKRPFPVGTERDGVAERQNRPVHRAVFIRNAGGVC